MFSSEQKHQKMTTKLDEMYSFNSVSLKNYYRLPVVCCHGSFFINVNRNSVVKIHERKLLHTWTLKNPHSFTCPVVFNIVDVTMCCIIDNNILTIWSENDDDLESSMKIKFQDSIFAILSFASERPLIIFCNGKCMPLDHAISSSKTFYGEALNAKEKLIWSDASIFKSKYSVYYLTSVEQSKIYNFYSFILNKEVGVIENLRCQPIARKACCLKDWCMNKYTNSFIAVWSDGLITSYNTANNSSKPILTIPGVEESNLLALDVIDRYHIAVMVANCSKTEYVLQIWDTQFSTLRNKKALDILSSNCFQIRVLDSTIFFPSNDNLAAVSVHVERSTLATVTGKLASSKPTSATVCEWVMDIEKNELEVKYLSSTEKQRSYPNKVVKSTPKLVDLVRKLGNAKNVIKSPADLINTSESELVQTLLFFLKTASNKAMMKNLKSGLLAILFCIPYDDIFLVKELKKLSFDEILIFLDVLQTFLCEKFDYTFNKLYIPTDCQILNWIYLILQSHVEEILLSKDEIVIDLLSNLHEAVLKQIEEADVEEEILHLLKLIEKGNILPERTFQEKYCIETLFIE